VLGRSRLEREMSEELEFHLERRAADLERSGLPPAEAHRRARIQFGAMERYKEECREARGMQPVDDLRADCLYVFRMLRRTPGFALVAFMSIALGVGANTFVFSVLNALVLRPLPIERPGDVVFVENTHREYPSQSFPNYRDLRDRTRSFSGLVAYRISPMNVETGDGAARVWGYLATGNYFDVLGVAPAVGRTFHQEDDRQPGASPFVVLSHDFWIARFGGDPGVVGRTIRINRLPFSIVGVAPPGFRGTERFYQPALWVPMMMQAQIEVGNPWLDRRGTFNVWMLGRLAPGVTVERATADLNAVAVDLVREFPDNNRGLAFKLTRPGLIGDSLGAPVRMFTEGVLALAGLVLLVACANIASLLLARGADRQREIAIRLSLGAGRGRLLRQLLTEALVLAIVGGLLGLALASLASSALSAWRAPLEFPVSFDVQPDWRVFLFAFATSTAAGVLFGVAPAHQASRIDPNAALKGTTQARLIPRRWAFRDVLVTLQIAISFVLVASCLLSLRGLHRLVTRSPGFDSGGVAIVGFELGLAGYSEAEGRQFQQRAVEAVRRLPGVRTAAYANSLPLSIDQSSTWIVPEDRPDLPSSEVPRAIYYQVSPGFFETLAIPLLAGRDVAPADREGAPLVAVVNESFARQIFQTSRPLGRRFRYGRSGPLTEVIGVVADGKYRSLSEGPMPVVFRSILQSYNSTTTLVARSALPPERLLVPMRHAIATLDPHMPLHGTGTLEEMLAFALFPGRAAALALSAFGLLAIVLSATGIHGMVAYAVARREREIGIRLALGAHRSQLVRLVVGRIVLLLIVGGTGGLLVTAAAADLLGNVVPQVTPRDPGVLGGVVLTIVAVAGFACWTPVRRALGLDPATTLRSE
jgi:predicted permease